MVRLFTCILAFLLGGYINAQLGKAYRDSLLAGISTNGVQIIFVDTFNTNSLDLTGVPRDVGKWTKSNQSGSPANPTINTTTAWYTVGSYNNKGYEWGSQAFLQQQLNCNCGVYLWSPVINFPDVDNIYARFALRSPGFSHSLAGNLTIGFAFDGNNDQVPDATPTAQNTVFAPPGSDPYSDYTAGNFFPNLMLSTRQVLMDLSAFRNRTGRIGIRISQSLANPITYQIDWFTVGTRPNNDLCQNALLITEGYNGGLRGYFNTTATGLIPSTNSSPGNRQGGATIYVGLAPNGTGAIPEDANNYKDGYQPNSPGPFGSTSATVENSTWFKFTTPVSTNCSSGNLGVRITVRNLNCACNATPVPRQLQFRIFNNTVCGTNTAASMIAITTLSSLQNNQQITANGLSFNTTYYILVDGENAADCKFRLQAETLLDGVAQTHPCTLFNPTPMPIEIIDFQEFCYENSSLLTWKSASNLNETFEIQGANHSLEWQNLGFVNPLSNQIYQYFTNQKFHYYRLKQLDFDGIEQFSQVLNSNCSASLEFTNVSPNPTNDCIYINNLPINSQIVVVDIKGKTILYHTATQNSNLTIDLRDYNHGLYLVVISSEKEQKTFKVLKR